MTEILNAILDPAKPQLAAALSHYEDELRTVRTGRANTAMLDGVKVLCYGSLMPLNQIASVNTPEATQLTVQPFDKGNIAAIRTAIADADLGFNPTDDGNLVRIIIPALTTERREVLVKQVHGLGETARVSVRGIRAGLREAVEKAKKEGGASEDQRDWAFEHIEKMVSDTNKTIETMTKEKEQELRTI